MSQVKLNNPNYVQRDQNSFDGTVDDDLINGVLTNDTMTGGTGADVFVFEDEFGNDIITDFEAGEGRTDRIWLKGLGFESFEDLTITDVNDGALVDAGSYGSILLADVNSDDLVADDFIL